MLHFGTDGIRGLANTELTAEAALSFARAAASTIGAGAEGQRFLVGRDTRASGEMLEAAVVAGICSAGAEAVLCGVIPTPALSRLVPAMGGAGGVMISASHNTFEYNGLKFVGRTGDKLSKEQEAEVELLAYDGDGRVWPARPGTVRRVGEASPWYEGSLVEFGRDCALAGMTVVTDCAHGALSEVAPRVLAELGAVTIAINCSPTGVNINDGGAVAPGALCDEVRRRGADAGLAFDGDGDRLVMVDEAGMVVNGDRVLGIWADDLRGRGKLNGGLVVGTVLTNSGLESFLGSIGCRLERAPVGDRYVADAMARAGATLGGETCGHTIYAPELSSSDAMVTGIAMLGIMARTRRPLSALASAVPQRPQVAVNLRIGDGEELLADPEVALARREWERALGTAGRIVLRPSGTEPLIRIMCECSEEARARETADGLAEVVLRRAEERGRVHADVAA